MSLSKVIKGIVKRAMPRRGKTAAAEKPGEPMSQRIRQEFWCNDCDGAFFANLSLGLNKKVLVVCPKCGRKHPRSIKDGIIVDAGGRDGEGEEILTTMATYSKTSRTAAMREKADKYPSRGGVPFDAERWAEMAARQNGEIE